MRKPRRQQPPETQEHGTPDPTVTPVQRELRAQIPQMPSQYPVHCVVGAVTLQVSSTQVMNGGSGIEYDVQTVQLSGH